MRGPRAAAVAVIAFLDNEVLFGAFQERYIERIRRDAPRIAAEPKVEMK